MSSRMYNEGVKKNAAHSRQNLEIERARKLVLNIIFSYISADKTYMSSENI